MIIYILQCHSNFHIVLAKIWVKKQVNRHYFQILSPFILSIFKNKACILHHFTFLDWLPTHYCLRPITHFQHLKSHFLTPILPFSAMCFVVLEDFVYTIAVDIYAFRLAFSSILRCILHHFTLRLAPKRTAFSTKTHCVLPQIARHFTANSPKAGANASPLEYKFILLHSHANPFLHQNKPSRESIFCGKVGRWWIKRALIMLKFLPKRLQRLAGWRVNRQAREQADKWAG